MPKYRFFSDVHANTSVKTSEADIFQSTARWAFIDFCRSSAADPDTTGIVSVGDLWDCSLEHTVDDVMKDERCITLRGWLQVVALTKKVFLVAGNHDNYVDLTPADRAQFEEWLGPNIHLTGEATDGDHWIAQHGHQFDISTGWWKFAVTTLRKALGIRKATAFIAWVIKWWVYHGRVPTVSAALKAAPPPARSFLEKWIIDRELNWLRTHPYTNLVTGHTHQALRFQQSPNRFLLNCGTWAEKKFTWVEIDDKGVGSIKEWLK